MVARQDWITLYANGIRYLEKAPLMYWSMAASFTLFGPQDWAARLPLALATLAVLLVYTPPAAGCSLPRSPVSTQR
jgi:4-amino-4-deoxy-L-arabinose transferase-like glycosyltransferase